MRNISINLAKKYLNRHDSNLSENENNFESYSSSLVSHDFTNQMLILFAN